MEGKKGVREDMELFRHLKTGEIKSENEWFQYFRGRFSYEEFPSWRDFREQLLISLWEEDLDFALGLGMTTIIYGMNKVPLKGIKWKGRDYDPPNRTDILYNLRKHHFMIGAEMGRANMISLDYDRLLQPSDYLYQFQDRTLRTITPHGGSHFFFWNDVFHLRYPRLSSYKGKPLKYSDSEWLRKFRITSKEGDIALVDNVLKECNIARIRNEISWIPPSHTIDGEYHWAEPRRPLMLFSELLISLSKGRR